MGISQNEGRMEGWLYLIRSNRFGLQYSRKRYFVLQGHHLRSFKSVPASKNEDPIRSAIIDSCIRVTDNGRESIQRKVFFIFTLCNTSNHNDQLKLGASSPEEAAQWIHNFQEAALKVSSACLLIWSRIAMLKRLTNDYVHMQADQNPGDVGCPRSDWQSLR
ncbi:hypothetical protein CsSME_00046523 [Camellia sinensis var. sinensis]